MKTIIYFLIATSIFLMSCKEENLLQPYGVKDSIIPGKVSNVRIENIPGGAVLKYDLPTDADLFYVKAVYQSSKGIQKSVSSSAYVDSLKIEGLGNTNEYEVKLFSVNHKEEASEPVLVKINPLTPPVETVFKSLKYEIDFGGFVVSYKNENAADIAIYVLRLDSTQTYYENFDAAYTSMKAGTFPVRGLPAKENKFGLYVRDRYDNLSDTLFFVDTPIHEEQLDKKLFTSLQVPGDVRWDFYEGSPEKTWDDVVSNGNYAHTDYPTAFPHRFTIDLGVDVKLSRFRFWQRPGDDVLYQHGAPKHYKVYGRADKPEGGTESNPLNGWTLLLECNSLKPSGLPMGQNSAEDVEFANKGEEFSFSRDVSVIRYIRFEMLESWSGMECSTISELSFWGQKQ